ncbi:hypothetical protein E7T06_11540 [Deinococcus sp. Arct2-2]|uniref:hypothetical protein n=1 Tax=Deinococcus sp. Arct2-2 TaxID=2568653 RepID=UPI0010A31341|nr:hypothetical protein [Deinococcus sp. Arct2-2]THF69536.1 hypothetical protein E7T06_11540 [Deinococcus sp. Arct2-2]
MKTIALGTYLALCLATHTGSVHAQTVDQTTRAGIDAHAFAYSGRHCMGSIEAQPAPTPKAITASQFKIVALVLDETLKEQAAKNRAFQFKSNFNDRDLYRAIVKDASSTEFVMMFLKASRVYLYKCELR